MLDAFGHLRELRSEFVHQHEQWRRQQRELDEAMRSSADRSHREELLRFQQRELEEADVRAGEEDALATERHRLTHAQRLGELSREAYESLYGGDGAVLVNQQACLRAGVYPVEYVDASGGGDAFDAGFIYGLLNNLSVEDCLRVASALGASCVRAIGTTPGVFTRRECEAFLHGRHPALNAERRNHAGAPEADGSRRPASAAESAAKPPSTS